MDGSTIGEPCTVTHWPAVARDDEATWYSVNSKYDAVVV